MTEPCEVPQHFRVADQTARWGTKLETLSRNIQVVLPNVGSGRFGRKWKPSLLSRLFFITLGLITVRGVARDRFDTRTELR